MTATKSAITGTSHSARLRFSCLLVLGGSRPCEFRRWCGTRLNQLGRVLSGRGGCVVAARYSGGRRLASVSSSFNRSNLLTCDRLLNLPAPIRSHESLADLRP